jgi:hypothetical protein
MHISSTNKNLKYAACKYLKAETGRNTVNKMEEIL